MSGEVYEFVVDESSGTISSSGGTGVAAAAAASAEAANRVKRKRKDPPAGGPLPAGARPPPSALPAARAAAAAPSPTLDSVLLPVPGAQHSSLQNEVLSLIFPGKSNHAQHLYRNLPGPLPISITRAHLAAIQHADYWCCEKSDGERAMLFVSQQRQACFLIDRKFLVRQLRHPVYAELLATQGDTLLDGELVLADAPVAPGQPLATFMIFDALSVNGQRTQERKLSQRLEAIGRLVVAPYRIRFPPPNTPGADPSAVSAPLPPLSLGAKAFHRKHLLKGGIIDHITALGHDEYEYRDAKRCNKNDGVIFTPEDDDYWCRSVPLLKWKWAGLNTIDFLTRAPWFDHEGKLMLYSTASSMSEYGGGGGGGGGRGGGGPTVTVHMRSTVLTPEKRAYFLQSVAGKESAIAEMQYDASSSSWQPKNFRWDKSAPNFMTTVIATLETIIDNVQPEDLYRVCARPGQQQQQSPTTRVPAAQPAAQPVAAAAPSRPPPPFYPPAHSAPPPSARSAAFDAIAHAPIAPSVSKAFVADAYESPFG